MDNVFDEQTVELLRQIETLNMDLDLQAPDLNISGNENMRNRLIMSLYAFDSTQLARAARNLSLALLPHAPDMRLNEQDASENILKKMPVTLLPQAQDILDRLINEDMQTQAVRKALENHEPGGAMRPVKFRR